MFCLICSTVLSESGGALYRMTFQFTQSGLMTVTVLVIVDGVIWVGPLGVVQPLSATVSGSNSVASSRDFLYFIDRLLLLGNELGGRSELFALDDLGVGSSSEQFNEEADDGRDEPKHVT